MIYVINVCGLLRLHKLFFDLQRTQPGNLEEFNGSAASRALKRPAPSSQQAMRQAKLWWSKPRGNRTSITESELTELVLKMVMESMLPFLFVEQPSFKEFITACPPGVAIPSRYAIVKTSEKKHDSSKAAVKSAMTSVEFVAKTAGCWTAHRRSYLDVTIHWLCYANFERKKCCLSMSTVNEKPYLRSAS